MLIIYIAIVALVVGYIVSLSKRRFPIWAYILTALVGSLMGAFLSFGDSWVFLEYKFLTMETSLILFAALAAVTLLFFDKNKPVLAAITILIILVSISGVIFLDSAPGQYDNHFREGDIENKSYITDDFSVWYPEDWYQYENGSSVLFTHEENLNIPANTDGFAIGSYFQVNVETLDNESGETMTEEQYFAQNLWVEGSEFLKSKDKVIINGLNLTRVVTIAAGADGEVLHYVFYDEPTRIITLSQYPYDKNSEDTRDFEGVVERFMPNFIGDGPDRSGILPFDSGVKGRVLLSPTCPVQKDPPDSNCTDKPFVTTVQVILMASSNSAPFAIQATDKNGEYTLSLPPGLYNIQAIGDSPFPICEREMLIVEPNTMHELNLLCDTGIR